MDRLKGENKDAEVESWIRMEGGLEPNMTTVKNRMGLFQYIPSTLHQLAYRQ